MQMYKKFALTNNSYVHCINYRQWRLHVGAEYSKRIFTMAPERIWKWGGGHRSGAKRL